ncbi:PREDICTED: signal transducing adapter molecule 2-like, partial [Acropora digitifera]|uniref:signal transducing adapter molecule 2-like n=1 Tax=Acropora digitifera TaxID=70779 RepID=UPI00077B1223
PSSLSQVEVKKVRALYDFEAVEDNELTFRTGQIISVLDDSDENWWKGETGGEVGLFPSNFVTFDLSEPESPSKIEKKKVRWADEPGSQQATEGNSLPFDPLGRKVLCSAFFLLRTANPTLSHLSPRETSFAEIRDYAQSFERIDLCTNMLKGANIEGEDEEEEKIQDMEDDCYKMEPLIKAKIEEIAREHQELSSVNEQYLQALNLYQRLMKEPLPLPTLPHGYGGNPQAMSQALASTLQQYSQAHQLYSPHPAGYSQISPPTSLQYMGEPGVSAVGATYSSQGPVHPYMNQVPSHLTSSPYQPTQPGQAQARMQPPSNVQQSFPSQQSGPQQPSYHQQQVSYQHGLPVAPPEYPSMSAPQEYYPQSFTPPGSMGYSNFPPQPQMLYSQQQLIRIHLNPTSSPFDHAASLNLADDCYKMEPLIKAKIEEIAREHQELSSVNEQYLQALNMYQRLMKEPLPLPTLPHGYGGNPQASMAMSQALASTLQQYSQAHQLYSPHPAGYSQISPPTSLQYMGEPGVSAVGATYSSQGPVHPYMNQVPSHLTSSPYQPTQPGQAQARMQPPSNVQQSFPSQQSGPQQPSYHQQQVSYQHGLPVAPPEYPSMSAPQEYYPQSFTPPGSMGYSNFPPQPQMLYSQQQLI